MFAATGLAIEGEAVERLLHHTECLPNETQQLSSSTWELGSHRDGPVTVATVDAAWEQVLDAESTRCIDLWTGLFPRQRLLLLAVGSGVSNGLYSDEIRAQLGLGPAASVRSSLRQLVERDVISEDVRPRATRTYRVPDPVLRAWLARLARQGSSVQH